MKRLIPLLLALVCGFAHAAGTVPNIFATMPSGNVAASTLDVNFALISNANTFSTYLTDTGGANAYVVAMPAGQTATLAAGLSVQFKASADNTGASTLNVAGTGVKNIINFDGAALVAGQIKSGGIVSVIYDGTAYQLGAGGSVAASAATATKLTTGRTIGMTGDLTWTSPAFDGTANVTAAGTLATANTNVGAFGSSTAIPTITANGKGLITGITTNAVVAPAGTLTGNLVVGSFNGGTGASNTTYWRGDMTWASPGGAGTPGGADTNVQINDAGAFYGDAGFVYAKATGSATLGVSNAGATVFTVNNVNVGAVAYAELQVGSNAGTLFIREQSTANGAKTLISSTATGGTNIYTIGATVLGLGTNSLTRMTIDSTGNVGIGTTTPSAKFAINGGLHVGGDSDPGDNNALIDGTLGVTGQISGTTIKLTTSPVAGYVLTSDAAGVGSWAVSPSAGTVTHTAGTLTTGNFVLGNGGADVKDATWAIVPVTNGGTGTGTAFTAGSVVFAGASGIYFQDNANWFYNATTKRLGITTASPVARLDLGLGTANTLTHLFQVQSFGTNTGIVIDQNANNSIDFQYNGHFGGSFPIIFGSGQTGFIGLGNGAPSALVEIGTNLSIQSLIRMNGVTSGHVDLTTEAAAGTWTLTLPNTAGTGGYFLQTNGSGITSWAAGTGGSGTVTNTGNLTANELVIGNAVADLKTLGSLGTTSTFLQGNAAGAPTWATKNWVDLTTDQTIAGTKTLSNGINAGDFSWVNATNLHGGWNGGVANKWTYGGPTLSAGSFAIGAQYTILSAGSTNFTLIGAANSTPGTHFTATGVGSGTGTATGLVTNWGIISGSGQSSGLFLVKDSGIGLTSIGEVTGSGAMWAMYTEIYKQASAGALGQAIGIEMDVVNRYNGTAPTDPYRATGDGVTGITEGIRLAVGTLGSQVSYNASTAIDILPNPDNGYGNPAVSFNEGIIFADGAISTPTSTHGDAIAFASGHQVTWFSSAGVKDLSITNSAGSLNVIGGLISSGIARIGQVNTTSYPASSADGGLGVSWNFTSGGAETNLWNLFDSGGGFAFRQKTGASSRTDLMNIDGSGNVTIPTVKSTTGVRYVCADTAGKLVSQAVACSGT